MLLSLEDYKSILQASLAWSKCERSTDFSESILSVLKDRFSFSVTVECTQANSSSRARGKQVIGNPRTITRKLIKDKVFEVSIVSKNGAELVVIVTNPKSRLKKHDCELLDELTTHLAAAHEQVSRIEALNHSLAFASAQSSIPPITFHDNHQALPLDLLTPRERQAVELLGEGLSNADIATRMNISRRTVEKHFESSYRKLGLENRYQLIREIVQ